MLRIPITDLKTIRIVCKKCNNGVIEVPANRLSEALVDGKCRFCRYPLIKLDNYDPIQSLKVALEELSRIEKDLGIEFEIPQP